ncbi:MAG TPA: methyltransferase domain-containing protein [Dehalococcoidales bacterium]|nr:methyltransferase domain-containing protein [Dehalococcoidales bacterium]
MNISKARMAEMLKAEQFPRSAKYDPEWVLKGWMGPNVLWLTEWLCERMELRPGMRVLDMGCGKALSSVFLAKEYGVQVWANDLWISATENWQRIREAGLEEQVYPIHAEAHSLPYAGEFFDAIVCLDSYQYFGTADLYLKYFQDFVRPGGQIGIVVAGLVKDFEGPVPEHLTRPRKDGSVFWVDECWCFHTAAWWRNLWARTGLVDVEVADVQPDGWKLWLQYEKACNEAGTLIFPSEEEVLEADAGRYLALIRMVGRRK